MTTEVDAPKNEPVTVCDGKYTFHVADDGWRIEIDRYGEPWISAANSMAISTGHRAVFALMCEVDELRADLATLRAAKAAAEQRVRELEQALTDHAYWHVGRQRLLLAHKNDTPYRLEADDHDEAARRLREALAAQPSPGDGGTKG